MSHHILNEKLLTAEAKVRELEQERDRLREELHGKDLQIELMVPHEQIAQATIGHLVDAKSPWVTIRTEELAALQDQLHAVQSERDRLNKLWRDALAEVDKWRTDYFRATGGPRYGIHSDEPY